MAVRTLSDISVDGEIIMEGLTGYPLTLKNNSSAGVNEIASTNRGLNFVVGSNTTTYFKDGSTTNMTISGYSGDVIMGYGAAKVGIGSTNPTDKLTVENGNIRLNTTSSYPAQGLYAYWNNSSPNMGGISWHQNPGFVGSEWTHYKTTSPYTNARIRLQGDTGNNGGMFVNVNNSNVLSVTAQGQVGVMCVPQDPLHVYGTLRVEDTSTSTATYAAISMEGRGMMGSAFTYLRTDYQGNFSVASGLSGGSMLRGISVGMITSKDTSFGGNHCVFESANSSGVQNDAVTMLFKANTDSQTGQYNEVGIEVDRMDGWSFSSTKRGKMRLQTGGNDHITMTTNVSEFGSSSFTQFNQVCTFSGVSSGIGFFSGTTATFAGKVGVGINPPVSKLDVNGGIRMADDTSAAASTNVGTLRYRTSGNNSYVDMCMQTGSSTYEWVNIVQNNW